MLPSSVSTMPEELTKQLGPERMRDLMTFLLTPPPQMPRDHAGPRPKARTLAEVNAILSGVPNPPEKTRPIRIVLVAGPKDHGAGEHDYPAWQSAWAELLRAADNVEVTTAWEWPTATNSSAPTSWCFTSTAIGIRIVPRTSTPSWNAAAGWSTSIGPSMARHSAANWQSASVWRPQARLAFVTAI